MTLSRPIAAAAEAGEVAISFEAAVLLMVVVVLGFLAKKLADLGRTVRRLENRLAGQAGPAGTGSAVAPVPSAAAHAATDIDNEALVVIAATVAAVWGPTARVVSVGEYHGARQWALEGRRQIFASHKIR